MPCPKCAENVTGLDAALFAIFQKRGYVLDLLSPMRAYHPLEDPLADEFSVLCEQIAGTPAVTPKGILRKLEDIWENHGLDPEQNWAWRMRQSVRRDLIALAAKQERAA